MKYILCPGNCGKKLVFDEDSIRHIMLHTYVGLNLYTGYDFTTREESSLSYKRALRMVEDLIAKKGIEQPACEITPIVPTNDRTLDRAL